MLENNGNDSGKMIESSQESDGNNSKNKKDVSIKFHTSKRKGKDDIPQSHQCNTLHINLSFVS